MDYNKKEQKTMTARELLFPTVSKNLLLEFDIKNDILLKSLRLTIPLKGIRRGIIHKSVDIEIIDVF